MAVETLQIVRAWDAVVITYFLAGGEHARRLKLDEIVRETAANQSKILVSRLATAEVAYFGNNRNHDEVEPHIVAFFASNAIMVADVTDAITKLARRLVRDFRFDGADAVHVATAVHFEVPSIETCDSQMLGAGERMRNSGRYMTEVVEPTYSGQPGLPI